MPGYLNLFPILVHSALVSSLLLSAGTVAVLCTRQPARRIRIIELTLAGLLLAPLLALVPGYPRWMVQLSELTRPAEEASLPERPLPEPAMPAEIEGAGAQLPIELPFAEENQGPVPDAMLVGVMPQPVELRAAELPEILIEGADARNLDAPIAETLPVETQLAETPAAGFADGADEAIKVAQSEPSSATILFQGSDLPETSGIVVESADAAHTDAAQVSAAPVDLRLLIVGAYTIGLGLSLAWSLIGGAVLWRLLRSARPADARCRALLRDVAGPASERVPLLVSSLVRQPCAIAWRRRPIVLPANLVATASEQELRWALAHEWSHVERGDVWSWLASGLVRALYFYQPLAWWLRGQLQLCQDFVADAEAARAGAADTSGAVEDYAEFLAIYASRLSRPMLPAGLGIGGRRTDLQRRVIMLVESRRPVERVSPRRWNLVAVPVAMAIVLGVGGLGVQISGAADEAVSAPPAVTETKETGKEAAPASLAEPANPTAPASPVAPATPVAADAPAQPPTATPTPAAAATPAEAGPAPAQPAAPAKEPSAVPASAPKSAKEPTAGTTQISAEETSKEYGENPSPGHNMRAGRGSVTKSAKAEKAGIVVMAPRTIAIGDQLRLDVMASSGSGERETVHILLRPDIPAEVEADGHISLGSHYGRLQLAGKTLGAAEEAIGKVILARLWADAEREAAKRFIVNARVAFVSGRPLTMSATFPTGATAPAAVTGSYSPTPIPQAGTVAAPAPFGPVAGRGPTYAPPTNQSPAHGTYTLPPPRAYTPAPTPQKVQPRKIAPKDVLNIQVADLAPLQGGPVSRTVIDAEGNAALGARWGRLNFGDKTLAEAEKMLSALLQKELENPKVQITFDDESKGPVGIILKDEPKESGQAITLTGKQVTVESAQPTQVTRDKRKHGIKVGDVLVVEVMDYSPNQGGPRSPVIVEPEGTVALGASYGRVNVEGKTLIEAEEAIAKKLGDMLGDPKVQVTYQDRSAPAVERYATPPAASGKLVRPHLSDDQQQGIETLELTLKKVREERDEIQRMYEKAKSLATGEQQPSLKQQQQAIKELEQTLKKVREERDEIQKAYEKAKTVR